MADPINYGMSDADRAMAAAQAFQDTSTASVAAAEQQYQSKVNELANAIVSGMSPRERTVLETQVQDLGNRYSQALAATQNQFAFAQQASQMTAQEVQRQYQELAQRQQLQASGALGAIGAMYAPGMATAAQEDAILAARQQGASDARYITGAQGISGLAQSLYSQALAGQRAATAAQLQGQQINLQTALETRALQAAADREQKERDRLREFEMAGYQEIQRMRQAYDLKGAELLAAARAADSTTERDRRLAELEMFTQKSDIELENAMRLLEAQTAASQVGRDTRTEEQKLADAMREYEAKGAVDLRNQLALEKARVALAKANEKPTPLTPEQQKAQAQAEGSQTKFASYVSGLIANKPTTPKTATHIKGQKFQGKFYVQDGQVFRVTEDPTTKQPITAAIPIYNVMAIINELAGVAQATKPTPAQLEQLVTMQLSNISSNSDLLLATQFILGTGDPKKITALLLSKDPGGTSSKPTNPYAGMGYSQLGSVYNQMIAGMGGTGGTGGTTSLPLLSAKPTLVIGAPSEEPFKKSPPPVLNLNKPGVSISSRK